MSRICLSILLACLAGCHASASRSWQLVPITENTEALAGARAAPAVEDHYGGVVRNGKAESRMARLGWRLTQAVPQLRSDYQYRLLDSDRPNAVSLPGGRIYITRALYEQLSCDDLIAAVLAHEMAHLVARDHFKPRPSNPDRALDKELSADSYAAELLDAAGLRPTALVDLVVLIGDTQPSGWVEARTANVLDVSGNPDNLVASASPQ